VRGLGRVSCSVAAALALASAGAGSRPALAQPAKSTETRETDARKACLTGDWQKGAALLAELFAESGEATYIYNQARCYQQNARPDEAINRFREYLRVAKNLPPDVVAETEGHIREMEAQKAAARPEAPPPTTPPPVAPPPMPLGPAPAIGGTTGDLGASGSPGEDRGRTKRIAGLAVAGVGVGLVVGGIVMGLQAKSAAEEVAKKYDKDKEASGKRAATLQWVGYGLGTAAVATGAVLYVLGRPADGGRSEGRISFAPTLAPQAVGGVVKMSF
jgi:hypothetical protein